MSDIDFPRMVIVTASHGEKYLGFAPKTCQNPNTYIGERAQNREPIELHDVRILMGQMTARQDAKGSVTGVQTFIALMPIDMFDGPVPVFHTLVSSWYFPSENVESQRKITQLIGAAEKNEMANKAVGAGLHLPTRSS
jgi:hypothetical protein